MKDNFTRSRKPENIQKQSKSLRHLLTSPLLLPLLALVAIWFLRLATLGVPPLIDSTEGRYAEISREMLAGGDWIVPRLDPDTPFWGKPVLWFWGTSASFALFGINEFSARLGSWVFSLIAMLAAMSIAHLFYDRMTALVTGLILSTCSIFFAMMGGVLTDPALLFGMTLAMAGFARCTLGPPSQRYGWGLLFFAGLGLGILAKGLIGVVMPGVGIAMWLLLFNRWRVLGSLPWMTGLLLFAALVVPWHLLAEWRSPGFLRYYIVGEHFLRYVDRDWQGDLYGNPQAQPKGMIIPFALAAALPWSLVLLYVIPKYAIWRRDSLSGWFRSDPLAGLLTCWFIGPLLFFSLSDNVNITYCLPMLPAFAVLMSKFVVGKMHGQPDAGKVHGRFQISPKRLAVACVIFSLIGCIGWMVGMTIVAQNKSQHNLVREFHERKSSDDDQLVYYDDMPYTAEFYSGGKTLQIKSDAEVRGYLQSTNTGWIAVDKNDLDDFAEWTPNPILEEIDLIGRFHIYRKRPAL